MENLPLSPDTQKPSPSPRKTPLAENASLLVSHLQPPTQNMNLGPGGMNQNASNQSLHSQSNLSDAIGTGLPPSSLMQSQISNGELFLVAWQQQHRETPLQKKHFFFFLALYGAAGACGESRQGVQRSRRLVPVDEVTPRIL